MVPSVTVLRHTVNLGQGAALETGMAYARRMGASIAVHFDGDGQHDPSDLPDLIAPLLQNEVDIVLGSRFLDAEGASAIPVQRRRLLGFARGVEGWITGIPLTDAHCGLRALGPRALEVVRLRENRMAHATELVQQIRQHALTFKEVPVRVRYTDYSQAKGQGLMGGFRILRDLLIRRWL